MDNSKYTDKSFYKDYKKSLDTIVPNTSMRDIDWDAISKRLSKKKENKKPIYIWWIAASIIGIILFVSYMYNYTICTKTSQCIYSTGFEEKVKNYPNSSLKPQNKLYDNRDKILSRNMESTHYENSITSLKQKNDLLNEGRLLDTNQYMNSNLYQNSTSSYALQKNRFESNIDGLKLTMEDELDSLVTTFQSQPKGETDSVSEITHVLAPLPTISSVLIETTPEIDQNIFRITPSPHDRVQWLGRFSFGKYFEKNLFEHSLSDYPSSIMESIASSKNGKQMNLFVLMQKHKWRFGLGVEYTSYEFETTHNTNFGVKDIDYQSTDGSNIKKYEYQYDIFDGSISSRVRLSLFEVSPNQTIHHNDTFNINMTLSRSISKVQIPIIVERKFLDFKKFSLNGKIGASTLIHTTVNNSLNHKNESCRELCFVHGFDPEVISKPSKEYKIFGVVGLGVEYHASSNISIGISPDFIIHPNHNYTSWLHQQALGFYISYKIK
ncbi:MAG: hypothetical protein KA234_04925 [Saprospiraceae bacterium]|jgi:hypothetical protein|nr:hypothetical protein [Saprospiraceae bacterium]